MCRSLSHGGQRCAASTRPGFLSAHVALTHRTTGVDPTQARVLQDGWVTAATEYAATPEGYAAIVEHARGCDG